MTADETKAAPEADSADADLLKLAAKRWESAYNRERDNIERAYADLKLLAGDDDEHWGPGVKAERESQSRPCFTVNKLPQFVEQVTGDQRQMRPSMRVVPVDSRASGDVAEKIGGILRYIEHRSNAAAVYNRAAESQVGGGVGAWRVVTEYAADSTFNQEIGIADIDDPVMVLFDPDATKLSRSDAGWCHVPVDLSREAFEARYPDKTPADFGDKNAYGFSSDWTGEDYIRVTEYWWKEPVKKLLALLLDGGIDDLTDEDDPKAKAAELQKIGARVEERDAYCVYRAVLSCDQVLEPKTKWPGRYIPIVPVIGKERRIGRRVVREGAIRHARDPQRIYNYSTSAQVEVTALQPKAPFVGTEAMFENHEDEWESANRENRPFLRYTPDPNASQPKPERVQPPVASQGIEAVLVQAAGDIEGTIGIYKSSIGAESNEKSGKAILAREKQADTSTYVFIQNLSEAIAHTARIVIDLIPHVYDTERELRSIGVDGTEELVKVNQRVGLEMIGDDGQPAAPSETLNDVTVGAYDVVVETGPSYATKREEAREGMLAFIQANNVVAPLVSDLIAGAMDWPNADKFAERLKMALPEPIKAVLAQQGDESLQPTMPDPAAIQQEIEGKVQQAEEQIALEKERAMLDLAKREIALVKQELALAMRDVQSRGEALAASQAGAQPGPVSDSGQGQNAAPEPPNPEIQAIAAAVSELQAVVGQIVQVLTAPPPPPEPEPIPPAGLAPTDALPPGGVFISEGVEPLS